MKKKTRKPAAPEIGEWTLPALTERRRAPRPAHETARQKALARAKRARRA